MREIRYEITSAVWWNKRIIDECNGLLTCRLLMSVNLITSMSIQGPMEPRGLWSLAPTLLSIEMRCWPQSSRTMRNNLSNDQVIDIRCQVSLEVVLIKTNLFFIFSSSSRAHTRRYRSLAVAAFEQGDARRSRTRVVLEVEQEILVEREPSLLPFSGVGTALPERCTQSVFYTRLRWQIHQLSLVNSYCFLHLAIAGLDP